MFYSFPKYVERFPYMLFHRFVAYAEAFGGLAVRVVLVVTHPYYAPCRLFQGACHGFNLAQQALVLAPVGLA